MFIVRDIFHLKFGHYQQAKALFDEARDKKMFPENQSMRMLTDFTGDSYRLILEMGFDSLTAYKKNLSEGMAEGDWKQWYENFKSHVNSSHREILKQVV